MFWPSSRVSRGMVVSAAALLALALSMWQTDGQARAKTTRAYPTVVGGVVALHGKHAAARMRCPVTASIRCGGEMVLRLSPGTPEAHILGTSVYRIPVGAARTIPVRLTLRARALLAGQRRVPARAAIHPWGGRTRIFHVTLVNLNAPPTFVG